MQDIIKSLSYEELDTILHEATQWQAYNAEAIYNSNTYKLTSRILEGDRINITMKDVVDAVGVEMLNRSK